MEYKLRVKVNAKLYKQALRKARRLNISFNDYLVAQLRKMVREKKLTLVA